MESAIREAIATVNDGENETIHAEGLMLVTGEGLCLSAQGIPAHPSIAGAVASVSHRAAELSELLGETKDSGDEEGVMKRAAPVVVIESHGRTIVVQQEDDVTLAIFKSNEGNKHDS